MLRSRRALRHLRFPEADGIVYPTLRYGAGTQTEAFLAGMVSPLYERSVFLIGTQLSTLNCWVCGGVGWQAILTHPRGRFYGNQMQFF